MGSATHLRLVRYFHALSEEGGLKRAAKRLGVSEQALGRNIKLLEQEVGIALLHRSVRPVAFTKAGRAFLVSTRPLLRADPAPPEQPPKRNSRR